MARISGVDLPRDKKVEIGLTYIFGIGRHNATDIIAKAGLDPSLKIRDLQAKDGFGWAAFGIPTASGSVPLTGSASYSGIASGTADIMSFDGLFVRAEMNY